MEIPAAWASRIAWIRSAIGAAAGLPLLAQAFRLKENLRGVFPAIASQNVEIRDAPHAAQRRHLNAKAVLLHDEKRFSRQAGRLVRLIGIGRGANNDFAGSPSICFASR